MFGKKSENLVFIKTLISLMDSLQDRIKRLEDRVPEKPGEPTVACDVCGCLVPRHLAIKGKSEIRTIRDYILYPGGTIPEGARVVNTNPATLATEIEKEYIHMRVALEASPNVDELQMRLKKLGGRR